MKISLLRLSSYADVKDWGDLVHTFTEWLEDSSLDEIILLLHTTKHVRTVSYDQLDGVAKLLLSAPGVLGAGTSPACRQQPHVRAVTGAQHDSDCDGQGQHGHTDIPEDSIFDGKEANVVISAVNNEEIDETRADADKSIQDAYRRYLEQKQVPAARRIQRAYRRYLKQKRVVRTGIDATQAQYWDLLRKRSMEMKWTKGSQYYVLFRVPLAYILVCLEVIEAFAESEKKVTQKRIMTEDHKDLGELTKTLSRYRYDSVDCTVYQGSNNSSRKLLKKTIALQDRLSPSSEFHEKKSVSDLQNAVQEVKVVVESLHDIPGSIETRNQIKKHWDRGWKWIFEKQGSRAKGKKAEKLKLVIDP